MAVADAREQERSPASSSAGMSTAEEPPNKPDNTEYYSVMLQANGDGHIGISRSPGNIIAYGTKMYDDMWIMVANNFTLREAEAYVHLNWKDQTPYSVAKGIRHSHARYRELTDEQFEALWYRMTLDEFNEKKAAYFAEEDAKAEAEAKAAKEINDRAKAEHQAALDRMKAEQEAEAERVAAAKEEAAAAAAAAEALAAAEAEAMAEASGAGPSQSADGSSGQVAETGSGSDQVDMDAVDV